MDATIQKSKAQPDYVLLIIVAVLVLWGLLAVGTISFPFSLERYGQPWHYLFHQILMLGIGIALGIIVFKFPLKTLKKLAPLLFALNLILLLMVFLPKIGFSSGGARRWLTLGNFVFQPSELLKITFILYLATWLGRKTKKYKKRKEKTNKLFLPFFIILAILVVILILQPDMTTLVIIVLSGILMYFVAATPFWHLLVLGVVGIAGGISLIKFVPYRAARLLVFLKPETDPLGIGYQLRQATIAIGSGKVFGIGQGFSLGLSRQKFGFLPQPMTDSIFAIIGEELGFIGCCFLIFLLLLFVWRGLKIAAKSEGNFERLLATGLMVWLTSQAFLNIGGIIGIIPIGGIPLPFFSYGGSHLIAEIIAIGILLNISKKL